MNRLLKIQLATMFVLAILSVNVANAEDTSVNIDARKAEFQQNVEQRKQAFQEQLQVRSEARSVKMADLNAQVRARIQASTVKIKERLAAFTTNLTETIAELQANIDAVSAEIDTSEAQQLLVDAKIAVLQAEAQSEAAYNAMYAAADGYVDPTAVSSMYTTTKNTALEAKRLVSESIKAYKKALADAVNASGINE